MQTITLDDLKQYAPHIDQQIGLALDTFQNDLGGLAEDEQSRWALATIREYALRPGKRLRGALAACLYDIKTGQRYATAGIALAAAIELMHDYLLIVDDIMDRSLERRGKPTVHEVYKANFAAVYPDDFEANMMAINAGLLTQHIASWCLAQAGVSNSQVQEVMHRNIAITGLGQMADVHGVVHRLSSPAAIIEKYQKKSSFYTFINPLACALALCGEYDGAARQQIEAFGVPAGLAFQLRDDWLGVFGDSALSGKSNLDDVHEGKNTYMVQAALAKADEEQKKKLLEILGNAQATDDDLATVRSIVTQVGAVDAAQDLMRQAADEAKTALDTITIWPAEFSQLLREVVQYSTERIK